MAVRRINLDPKAPMLQDYVDPKKYTYLPNTAGCHTASEAVRTLRLAREAGGWNLVKLEVLGPPPTLYPDMAGTLEAAEALIKDGFEVMVYTADDPVACKRLEEMGCVAIMPLGAPIGSGLGIQNAAIIWMIREQTKVPFLVDAGVGTASDAAIAMELGCDAVLLIGDRPCQGPDPNGAGDEVAKRCRPRRYIRAPATKKPLPGLLFWSPNRPSGC